MTIPDELAHQRTLVGALSASLATEGAPVRLFETHISWVLVAGNFAYKLKKALRFDFLDFSTLAARRFFCLEELRLNARLAPDLYLDVVTITGCPERPQLSGEGEAIEYAVRMRAFAQQALWSNRLRDGLLNGAEVDALADRLARFHDDAPSAPAESDWGSPRVLHDTIDETIDRLLVMTEGTPDRSCVDMLIEWEGRQRLELAAAIAARKPAGMVRECHGDLHLANILTLDGKVEAFDCIEFNDRLRWIDVLNDLAFATMDLRAAGRGDLSARLRNGYLEQTGDHAGLPLLRYFEVHRALVRCKIALLQAAQGGEGAMEAAASARAYLSCAVALAQPRPAAIVIMHGFSGCGKSTLCRALVEAIDGVQLRSDVERKRMYRAALPDGALYGAQATDSTYAHLQSLASLAVAAGYSALVDATFLKRAQREPFRQLATALGVPFIILDLHASEATMRARIATRARTGRDASDATGDVLSWQMLNHEPLDAEELLHVARIDTEDPEWTAQACTALQSVLGAGR